MHFVQKLLAAAGLAMGLAAAPASASVIFNFDQVGPTVGNPGLVFDGSITVSDAAYARGFSVSLFNFYASGPFRASLNGLQAVNLTFSGSQGAFGGGPFEVTLADLLERQPINNVPPQLQAIFNLSGNRTSGLTGNLVFNDTERDFALNFTGETFTGTVSSDGPLGCAGLEDCTFAGNTTVTRIPEPASMSLLAVGVGALVAARRRRRTIAA